jgi:hypothetical protein
MDLKEFIMATLIEHSGDIDESGLALKQEISLTETFTTK